MTTHQEGTGLPVGGRLKELREKIVLVDALIHADDCESKDKHSTRCKASGEVLGLFDELFPAAPAAPERSGGSPCYIATPDGTTIDGCMAHDTRAAAEADAQSMRDGMHPASVREFREVGQPAEPSQGRECWVLYHGGNRSGVFEAKPDSQPSLKYGWEWVRMREVVEPQERGT